MVPVTVDVAALRRGDRTAVDALYRVHARTVLGWVIRLGGARLDAEDVAHQVFETAIGRVGSFRGDSSVTTWLYGITRRVVANARRRVWVRRMLGMDSVPEVGVRADSERLATRRGVQQCLEGLSVVHREALVLLLIEERAADEVAEMLGVPVGTVYSRAFHARRQFAAALEQAGLGPDDLPRWE